MSGQTPFPRGTDLPGQSPLFWVQHKDRYLRQLLIRDIEAETGRQLIVYHSDCNIGGVNIDHGDDVYMAELLNAAGPGPVDLMIETNGGNTDATEKICSQLCNGARDLRVIVPRRAKSNGTVIALAGFQIVMGMESELGPIDPAINDIPVEFILGAANAGQQVDPVLLQAAIRALDQTKKLAGDLLAHRMLKGVDAKIIGDIIAKLAARSHYHSHGSVVNAEEATALGLKVLALKPDDQLWRKFCLLRAMFQHDCVQIGAGKLFEGAKVSLVVDRPRQP
ncbi:hypothetical protein ABIC33_001246 [Variovorax sp. 1140]|uniref:SDH family Clp fold serine proteinase n=1 Tax=Variovorax atrisoli TaxID=3394203 RepID=UPI003393D60F